jgi:hypothetical protein
MKDQREEWALYDVLWADKYKPDKNCVNNNSIGHVFLSLPDESPLLTHFDSANRDLISVVVFRITHSVFPNTTFK